MLYQFSSTNSAMEAGRIVGLKRKKKKKIGPKNPSNNNLIWKSFLILLSWFNLWYILSVQVTVCAGPPDR